MNEMTTTTRMLDTYGPLVLINLPERTDRRSEFDVQLKRIGLSLDHPKVHVFPAIRPDTLEGFPTLGTRGCFLSHMQAMEQALASGATSIILCEDDLDFVPDFLTRLPAVLDVLDNTQWDIFYAGYTSHYAGEAISADANIFRVPGDLSILCSHFYLIEGNAIADLIAYLGEIIKRPAGHPDGGPMHYDGALNHYRADRPDLVTLAILPTLGTQRPSRTDIHALRWFDKIPFVREFVNLARKLSR
jgi:hypothetical protein